MDLSVLKSEDPAGYKAQNPSTRSITSLDKHSRRARHLEFSSTLDPYRPSDFNSTTGNIGENDGGDGVSKYGVHVYRKNPKWEAIRLIELERQRTEKIHDMKKDEQRQEVQMRLDKKRQKNRARRERIRKGQLKKNDEESNTKLCIKDSDVEIASDLNAEED